MHLHKISDQEEKVGHRRLQTNFSNRTEKELANPLIRMMRNT